MSLANQALFATQTRCSHEECLFQEFEDVAIDSQAKAMFHKAWERMSLLESEYKAVSSDLAFTKQVLANERSISSNGLSRSGSPLIDSYPTEDSSASTVKIFQELRKDFRHALSALGQRNGEIHSMLVTEKVVLEQKAKRAKVEVSRFQKKISALEAVQNRSTTSPDSVARTYAQEVVDLRRELEEKETEVSDAKAKLDCYKVWLGEADSTLYLWDDETGISLLALEIEKEIVCKDLQLREEALSKIKKIIRNGDSCEDSLSQIKLVLAELEPFEAHDSSDDLPLAGADKENINGGSPAPPGAHNHILHCAATPVTPTSVARRLFGDTIANSPTFTSPNPGHKQKKVRVSSMSNIGKREPIPTRSRRSSIATFGSSSSHPMRGLQTLRSCNFNSTAVNTISGSVSDSVGLLSGIVGLPPTPTLA